MDNEMLNVFFIVIVTFNVYYTTSKSYGFYTPNAA